MCFVIYLKHYYNYTYFLLRSYIITLYFCQADANTVAALMENWSKQHIYHFMSIMMMCTTHW